MSNPLPEILELITEKQMILDLLLVDSMREIITKITGSIVNNSYVVLMLNHLKENNLLEIKEITLSDMAGSVILIRKLNNGY